VLQYKRLGTNLKGYGKLAANFGTSFSEFKSAKGNTTDQLKIKVKYC
jgi:hypothetical protein